MQTPDAAQFFPIVGSQSLPRFELLPQTLYIIIDAVTLLHWLLLGRLVQAFGDCAGSHEI